MVATPVLGTGVERRVGSSPTFGTKSEKMNRLPNNCQLTIKNTKLFSTYVNKFGKDNKQELKVIIRCGTGGFFIRVEELNVESPYIQWFIESTVDDVCNLLKNVKKCLSESTDYTDIVW